MAMIASIATLLGLAHRATGFDVIGAGLRHTGCDELGKALDILGYNSYHSGRELPSTHADWVDIMEEERGLKSGGKKKNRKAALEPLYKFADGVVKDGHKAIVSSPAAFYALDLLRKHPKAKVILTEHDSTKEWFYEAQKGTQIALHRDMVKAEYHKLGDCPLPPADADIAECTAGYESHNKKIRAKVPPGQLLEFKVSDGWAPLCEFLGVPVPNEPFPAGKNAKQGVSTVAIGAVAAAVLILVLLVVAASTSTAAPSGSKKTE